MNTLTRLFILCFSLATGAVYAECASPTGAEGQMYYDGIDNVVNFCDGTNWRMTGASIPSAGSTGCTTPTGTEGQVIFNGTHNVAQFCNGDDWVNMGAENASAGTTGCTSPAGTEGQMIYSSTANWLQYCDGDNWVNAGQLYVVGGAASCPSGFVLIPGSEGIDSQANGWCVSKYEMTPHDPTGWGTASGGYRYDSKGSDATVAAKSGQTPINYISRDEAATQCSSDLADADGNAISSGKLLTVQLWSLLAQDITDVAENWSSGVVGTGYMSRGHANGQPNNLIATGADSFPATTNMTSSGSEYWSRTYKTSNGDIVWDLAGNAWEWFDDLHAGGSDNWRDHNAGTFTFGSIALEASQGSYTQAQGVGQIFSSSTGATAGSSYAAQFGGAWSAGRYAGVWTSIWSGNSPSSARYSSIGFRCIAPAQ